MSLQRSATRLQLFKSGCPPQTGRVGVAVGVLVVGAVVGALVGTAVVGALVGAAVGVNEVGALVGVEVATAAFSQHS